MMVMYQNGRDSIKLGRVHREHWQCHLARCSSSPEHIDTLGSGTKEKSARPLVLQNLVNTIVDAANGHDVMDSIINGKLVMKNREVLTLDEERIRFEATQHMNEIIKRAY